MGNTVVFTCEDDLWTVPVGGGVARRLTANAGECQRSMLSPDGSLLAFTGREEGHPEVYLMPAEGGMARRLTYQGAALGTHVVGWMPDGKSVIFASNAGQPFMKMFKLFRVGIDGSLPVELPYGSAMSISFGANGGTVLGRNTLDIARWKRYRGGTAGELWVDASGKGKFKRLLSLNGNFANPMWIGKRIYFVGDHEGVGNIYSCTPSGGDVKRHTHLEEYYVRNASTDGTNIVFHAGGELYFYDVAKGTANVIDVTFHSPRVQQHRKFVDAARFLEDYAMHPAGHSFAASVRGKSFTMPFWEEAAVQQGERDGVRYRLIRYLNDGKRLVMISDAGGEEALEMHHADNSKAPVRFAQFDLGRALEMLVSPKADQLLITNQRLEVILVDLATKKMRTIDTSAHRRISGMAWSPDGKWVAYSYPDSPETSHIRVCDVAAGKPVAVTETVFMDVEPTFDPEGKYLYFLSYREFNPVYDNMHFDLNFPRGVKPFAIALRNDVPSPFEPPAHAPDMMSKKMKMNGMGDEKGKKQAVEVKIDLEGILHRVIAFPVPEGRYGQIGAVRGKCYLLSFPIEGSLGKDPGTLDGDANGTLEVFDFDDQKRDTIADGVSNFKISNDAKFLMYRAGRKLRVMSTSEGPNGKNGAANGGPSRQNGWIDLGRMKVSVVPTEEWKQMYREAWRLQRDQFWTPDMSRIDWKKVFVRYQRLLDRIATRSEFSDLMWEMQGELGTSHCYEMGGDYRPEPRYAQGFLGADLVYDAAAKAYRVRSIVNGDAWKPGQDSPLRAPGVNVNEGDLLLAIEGRVLDKDTSPQALLVNRAGENVAMTFADAAGKNHRHVIVKTLRGELLARYRQWVEANRAYVHKASGGRVGYVHVPDMGPWGFAEFHRYYITEVGKYDSMIVDVRFNGGGHVSQLLLEKLARRRTGYDLQRYGEPQPYPSYSVLGPIVAITNENAGSDGDIFSHNFKLMKLGPLVGKRTWGGVIGIWPRHALVDGSVTTQPEFSFWFHDVGWGVENYGTDPDIDIDFAPQDYAAGRDPQLDAALKEMSRLLKAKPPKKPDFKSKPNLAQPKLPNAKKK